MQTSPIIALSANAYRDTHEFAPQLNDGATFSSPSDLGKVSVGLGDPSLLTDRVASHRIWTSRVRR